MEQPTLCLLGRPAVLEEGRLTTLALRPKALALLAYLALAGGAVVRRDLAGLLFPDAGDPLATLRWRNLRSRRGNSGSAAFPRFSIVESREDGNDSLSVKARPCWAPLNAHYHPPEAPGSRITLVTRNRGGRESRRCRTARGQRRC